MDDVTNTRFARSTGFRSALSPSRPRPFLSANRLLVTILKFLDRITVFFVLLVMMNNSLLTSFLVALVPVGICLAYIFGFRQGKPPGYDRDCFEHWFSNGGFAPEVQTVRAPKHPLVKDRP